MRGCKPAGVLAVVLCFCSALLHQPNRIRSSGDEHRSCLLGRFLFPDSNFRFFPFIYLPFRIRLPPLILLYLVSKRIRDSPVSILARWILQFHFLTHRSTGYNKRDLSIVFGCCSRAGRLGACFPTLQLLWCPHIYPPLSRLRKLFVFFPLYPKKTAHALTLHSSDAPLSRIHVPCRACQSIISVRWPSSSCHVYNQSTSTNLLRK